MKGRMAINNTTLFLVPINNPSISHQQTQLVLSLTMTLLTTSGHKMFNHCLSLFTSTWPYAFPRWVCNVIFLIHWATITYWENVNYAKIVFYILYCKEFGFWFRWMCFTVPAFLCSLVLRLSMHFYLFGNHFVSTCTTLSVSENLLRPTRHGVCRTKKNKTSFTTEIQSFYISSNS